ncbi:Putative Histone acetyltransferase HPA2/related acetyltransferase [Wenzhouxiangella marina]|uniref:Putative Histone acetyltransferase HPA2/related acetyltransferase n=2 Tax=Wenzhouxiangella marina TaxID=1579979 RepID=A0A0K0XUK3_9GAMM|nr:Putative Histone acetyltransferase HPA2/related acetyltransferase [Wenzhouxiangella marina]
MTSPDMQEERAWLENTLTRQIPLGGAMQLRITELNDRGLRLALPLAANINDKGTVFGGAMVSAMILAGWSLPRLLLRRAGRKADLVIGRCEVRFLKPVAGPFEAVCRWPAADEIEAFLARLDERGRSSMNLAPEILADGEVAARLEARYAALAHVEETEQG